MGNTNEPSNHTHSSISSRAVQLQSFLVHPTLQVSSVLHCSLIPNNAKWFLSWIIKENYTCACVYTPTHHNFRRSLNYPTIKLKTNVLVYLNKYIDCCSRKLGFTHRMENIIREKLQGYSFKTLESVTSNCHKNLPINVLSSVCGGIFGPLVYPSQKQ